MKLLHAFKKAFLFSSPFLLGLLLILFSQIPNSLMPYYHQSFPFVICIIFYFAIFNPKVLNIFFVFLLGLIMDMLTTLPLGFYAFGFVFLFFMTTLFQSYLINMVFKQLWVVFSLFFFCSVVIWAFLFFLVSGTLVSTGFWFVQYLFICLSYPFFCRLSGFLNRQILEVQ